MCFMIGGMILLNKTSLISEKLIKKQSEEEKKNDAHKCLNTRHINGK